MNEIRIPIAREWMNASYMALRPEMDLLEAIQDMASRGVSGALVLDDGDKLLGILTEKDCLRVLTLTTYHEARAGTVREFMSPLPECAAPDMDLFRVSKLFLDTNFPLLPVLQEDRVVGQITRQGMLQVIQNTSKQMEAAHLQREKVEEESGEMTRRPRSIQELQKTFADSTRDQLVRRLKRKG